MGNEDHTAIQLKARATMLIVMMTVISMFLSCMIIIIRVAAMMMVMLVMGYGDYDWQGKVHSTCCHSLMIKVMFRVAISNGCRIGYHAGGDSVRVDGRNSRNA